MIFVIPHILTDSCDISSIFHIVFIFIYVSVLEVFMLVKINEKFAK